MSRPDFLEALRGLSGGEEELARVLETAPFGIYVDHPSLGCTFASQALLDQFGVTWEEFRGFGWARFVAEEDAARLQERIRVYETELEPIYVSYRVKAGEGAFRWVHARVHPVVSPEGKHLGSVGITSDQTLEREFQDRLGQTQQLEAIGRHAAQMAHDLNNLFTPLLFGVDFLEREVSTESARRSTDVIKKAVGKAQHLTSQLLTLSRRRARRQGCCSLEAELERQRPLLASMLGEGIQLDWSISTRDTVVPVDPVELTQVVMNLCSNASDAMQGRGAIRVVTEPIPQGVSLCVHDTGEGMSEQVIQNATQPFYTTKEAGRGTGLGLHIVQEVLEIAGGALKIRSQPGQGSEICCEFPVLDTPVVDTTSAGTVEASRDDWNLVALLVEDQDSLRQSLSYALALHGIRVMAAESLQTARAKLDEETPDLIISDVLLPDGISPDLMRELRPHLPDVPVLFISGYADENDLEAPDLQPSSFLAKPFGSKDFLNAIERLLGRVNGNGGSRKRPDGS